MKGEYKEDCCIIHNSITGVKDRKSWVPIVLCRRSRLYECYGYGYELSNLLKLRFSTYFRHYCRCQHLIYLAVFPLTHFMGLTVAIMIGSECKSGYARN